MIVEFETVNRYGKTRIMCVNKRFMAAVRNLVGKGIYVTKRQLYALCVLGVAVWLDGRRFE